MIKLKFQSSFQKFCFFNMSCQQNICCCQVVWQIGTLGIKIFLFHISINLFRSWHTFIKNKLMRTSLFFKIVCQLWNKFMLVPNKNLLIRFVHFCQNTWQQHKSPIVLRKGGIKVIGNFEIGTLLFILPSFFKHFSWKLFGTQWLWPDPVSFVDTCSLD